MRFRSAAVGVAAFLVAGLSAGAVPGTDAPTAPPLGESSDPARARLRELLTSPDGRVAAPKSPRFAALREPGLKGTRFVVGWLVAGQGAADRVQLSSIADALGRSGGGVLEARLPALGGRVTSTVTLEELAGSPLLVIAVESTRPGVDKELELAVLEATATLSEDPSVAHASLARRALSPLARAVVGVNPPDAPRSFVRLPKPRRHVIESGDTLSEIAQSHGLDLDALVSLNGMDPNKPIHPGEELKLNAGGPRPKLYVAKPGDTLAKVARHFGVSEKALREVNRVEARSLTPGQKLVLPR